MNDLTTGNEKSAGVREEILTLSDAEVLPYVNGADEGLERSDLSTFPRRSLQRVPLAHLAEMIDEIVDRAPEYPGSNAKMPCHAAAWDIDDNLGITEHFHLLAFRQAIGDVTGRPITDEEWAYFDQRCFKRADREASAQVILKALEAEKQAVSDAASDFSSIQRAFARSGLDPAQPEVFQAMKIEAMGQIMQRDGVMPVLGSIGLLLYYRSWEIPCVPCTGSPPDTARRTLSFLGINTLFASLVADGQYHEGKPHKECFFQGAQHLADSLAHPERGDEDLPAGFVIHATDNRTNGAWSAAQVAGCTGTVFLGNHGFDTIEQASKSLLEQMAKHPFEDVNPIVLVPGAGYIALRDRLIDRFGFAPPSERIIPEGGRLVQRVMSGEEWYEHMAGYTWRAMARKWEALGKSGLVDIDDI